MIMKVSKKTLIEGIIKPRLVEIFGLAIETLEKQNLLNATPAGKLATAAATLRGVICPLYRGRQRTASEFFDD